MQQASGEIRVEVSAARGRTRRAHDLSQALLGPGWPGRGRSAVPWHLEGSREGRARTRKPHTKKTQTPPVCRKPTPRGVLHPLSDDLERPGSRKPEIREASQLSFCRKLTPSGHSGTPVQCLTPAISRKTTDQRRKYLPICSSKSLTREPRSAICGKPASIGGKYLPACGSPTAACGRPAPVRGSPASFCG